MYSRKSKHIHMDVIWFKILKTSEVRKTEVLVAPLLFLNKNVYEILSHVRYLTGLVN